MAQHVKRFGWWLLALVPLVWVVTFALRARNIAADDPQPPPPPPTPTTEEGADPGEPTTPEEEEGEKENEDGCEDDPGGKQKPGDDEDGEPGCENDRMRDAMGQPELPGPGGDGPGPNPPPGGPDSPDPDAPPEEHQSDPSTNGSDQDPGNGNTESPPDPQGEGGNGNTDGQAPDQNGPKDPKPATEGGTGESGGGNEGDGEDDNKGGEADGSANQNCQSAEASGQTPPPVNQNPPGGSAGENPGFLNAPMVYKYRSNDPLGGLMGIGFDANIFERLIIAPARNPLAAVAWYPGDGGVHYFNGSILGGLGAEPAIQDTHSLSVNMASQLHRYILTDKFGNNTYFNTLGGLTLKQDRFGNTNQYVRSLQNKLVSISSSYGHPNMWSFEYFPTGRLKAAVDFSNRRTTFGYDQLGHLIQVVYPATTLHPTGKKFGFNYYPINGKMHQLIDPAGIVRTEWIYDAQGFVTTLKRGDGMHAMSIQRTSPSTRLITDFSGTQRLYTFQPNLHYPTRVELFTHGSRPGDPLSYVWEYTFNPQRQVTAVTLPSGKNYAFTHDLAFNLGQRTVTPAGGGMASQTTWTYGAFNMCTSVQDSIGNTWTYQRDPQGLVTAFTSPGVGATAGTTSFTYNAAGQIATATSPTGRTVTYNRHVTGPYAGWIQNFAVTDPQTSACGSASRTTQYTHNIRGYPVTRTDAAGYTATFQRDEVDRIKRIEIADTLPLVRELDYGLQGIPSGMRSENRAPDGTLHPTKPWIAQSLQRDARRRIVGITADFDNAVSATTTVERDGLGNVTKVTSAESRQLTRAWDERGLPLRTTLGTTNVLTWDFAYHASGTPSTIKNALGDTTTIGEDGFGRITSVTEPGGVVASRTLDLAGRVTGGELRSATNTLMSKYAITRDVRNRPTAVTFDRFGHGSATESVTFEYEFNKISKLTKEIYPLGRTYSYTYYACGRPWQAIDDQTGGVRENVYDDRGMLVQAKRTETEGGSTKSYSTEYDYDAVRRLTQSRSIDADNAQNLLITTYVNDSLGRVRSVSSTTSAALRFEYNHAGFVTAREEDERIAGQATVVRRTEYTWNRDGQLLSVKDPTGARTDYEYEEHGWLKKVHQPNASTTVRTYDGAGRLATWTDANGTVVTNSYDVAGRLVGRSISRATGVLGTTSETFVYDAGDRVVSQTDDDSIVETDYDSMGNELAERQGPSSSQLLSIQKTFTKEGFSTGLTYPGSLAITRTQDTAGRLHKALQGSSVLLERTYARTFLLGSQASLGGVAKTDASFDGFARVGTLRFLQIPQQGSPTAHFDVEYGYDGGHQRLYERRLHASNSGDLYTYDDLGRTKSVLRGIADPAAELQNPGSQTYADRVDYVLDGAGTRSQVVVTPYGGTAATTNYTSNAQHEYTVIGGTNRTHDANGNLASNGTFAFAYDYMNRLVEVRLASNNTVVASYEYDAAGRRTAKTVGSTTTRYYYSGPNLVEVRDSSGTATHQFVFGSGVDDVVLMRRLDSSDYDQDQNTTEYLWFSYHRDPVNSVRLITDMAGAVVESYTYDAFGAPTIRDAAGQTITASLVENTFMFTAREWDAEIELYHYRARHYDPAVGAFLQRDPEGFVDGPNLYAYAHNSPFNYMDPFGLDDDGPGWLDWVQTGLDGLGFIPGLGAIPDVLNAGISAARGNWGDAALSLGAAVPGFGDATAGVAKVAKAADKVADAAKSADHVADAAKAAGKAAEGAGDAAKGAGKVGEAAEKCPPKPELPSGTRAGDAGKAGGKGPLKNRMGDPPKDMKNPQAHHDLPQKHREKFEKAGMDIDDPQHGRWVEGGPEGNHQKWSSAFNKEWDGFFEKHPNPSQSDIIKQRDALRGDPRFK